MAVYGAVCPTSAPSGCHVTWKEQHMQPQLMRKWYTVAEVAEMLEFGLSKTKMLVSMQEIRSVKIGGHRRILPEWVDEYVQTVAEAGE
jgi:excisionase family DNA binding protein